MQVAQVPGDRGRPDVERDPQRDVVEPGADPRDRVAVVHAHGDRPAAVAERPLQPGQDHRIDPEVLERPLLAERPAQPLGGPRSGRSVGLRHLDVVQPDDRVDLDRVRVGLLADDLAVQLRLGRDVDDEVAGDPRVTAETPVGREPVAGAVALLGLGERDQVASPTT